MLWIKIIKKQNCLNLQETRHQLFKLRPSQHASWIGFAMSYHLLGDFATANSVLDTFRQSQVNVSATIIESNHQQSI